MKKGNYSAELYINVVKIDIGIVNNTKIVNDSFKLENYDYDC